MRDYHVQLSGGRIIRMPATRDASCLAAFPRDCRLFFSAMSNDNDALPASPTQHVRRV